LIDFGSFQIRTYGLFVALGILAAFFVALSAARKRGISDDDVFNLAFSILFPAIIGARIAYVISEWNYYASRPGEILAVWHGGLASFGGIFGGLLGGFIYVNFRKLSFLKVADAVALGLPLGFAIGRLGCFFNGCCYGIVMKSPISFGFCMCFFV
jgi:phosphatidylglycerol:prolipoprotein diacylglycerol transferase